MLRSKKKLFERLLVGAATVGVISIVQLGLHAPAWMGTGNPRYSGCGRHSCIANLKQMEGAIFQWALETKKAGTDRYSFEEMELLAYMKGSHLPECPQGGSYYPGVFVDAVPLCTLGPSSKYDHKIPMPKLTLAELRKKLRKHH